MKKPTKTQKNKIGKLEKDIKEGDTLWDKIKRIPKQDKFLLKQLRSSIKPHKAKKKKVPKSIKQKADKAFWGLEPPESRKRSKH